MTTANPEAPLILHFEAHTAAEPTANTGQEVQICRVPWPGLLAAASFTAEQNVTGVNTNCKNIVIRNRKQNGAGNTQMAVLGLAQGTNLTAFDERVVPVSATQANLVVAQDDIITYWTEVVGTGLIMPEGKAVITLSRTDPPRD